MGILYRCGGDNNNICKYLPKTGDNITIPTPIYKLGDADPGIDMFFCSGWAAAPGSTRDFGISIVADTCGMGVGTAGNGYGSVVGLPYASFVLGRNGVVSVANGAVDRYPNPSQSLTEGGDFTFDGVPVDVVREGQSKSGGGNTFVMCKHGDIRNMVKKVSFNVTSDYSQLITISSRGFKLGSDIIMTSTENPGTGVCLSDCVILAPLASTPFRLCEAGETISLGTGWHKSDFWVAIEL